MSLALVWFRDDLRLSDHAAVTAAAAGGNSVLAVYVLDEAAAGRWKLGGASRWWLHGSLAALGEGLRRLGSTLILRRGDAAAQLRDVARAVGAAEIHAGNAREPWGRAQEARVAAALAEDGVAFHGHRTTTLFDPGLLRTRAGGAFQVYSPFARACLASGGPPPPLPPPGRLPAPARLPRSDRLDDWGLLPTSPDWAGGLRETWVPGEAGARNRMRRFLSDAAFGYAAARDRPEEDATSRLSPHLHWGELSAAELWHEASAIEGPGSVKFRNELLWREFSAHLLWHFPHMPERPLRPVFDRLEWRSDPSDLRAWQSGRTGIPIVDAGLRQLWHTGWMHNRVRMIAASFLVKHLLVDWRAGEAWFWDTLVDADLANNSASWQWIAGSGSESAPYVRVFNPILQARRFDPDGAYIRTYVPELARLPAADIHAPWEAPEGVLRAAGVDLGRTYPRPIVDLAAARARALAAYARLGSEP